MILTGLKKKKKEGLNSETNFDEILQKSRGVITGKFWRKRKIIFRKFY